MRTSQAEARLKKLLKKNGFDKNDPNPQIAWRVFKEFSGENVTCAEDGFLFQVGCYDFTGKPLFYLDFVRQFLMDDATGEYDHMEQLHIEFTRQTNHDLDRIKANLWAYDFESLAAFFSTVEHMPEFQQVMIYGGWKCKVYQHVV